jgi:hypothetical protein
MGISPGLDLSSIYNKYVTVVIYHLRQRVTNNLVLKIKITITTKLLQHFRSSNAIKMAKHILLLPTSLQQILLIMSTKSQTSTQKKTCVCGKNKVAKQQHFCCGFISSKLR